MDRIDRRDILAKDLARVISRGSEADAQALMMLLFAFHDAQYIFHGMQGRDNQQVKRAALELVECVKSADSDQYFKDKWFAYLRIVQEVGQVSKAELTSAPPLGEAKSAWSGFNSMMQGVDHQQVHYIIDRVYQLTRKWPSGRRAFDTLPLVLFCSRMIAGARVVIENTSWSGDIAAKLGGGYHRTILALFKSRSSVLELTRLRMSDVTLDAEGAHGEVDFAIYDEGLNFEATLNDELRKAVGPGWVRLLPDMVQRSRISVAIVSEAASSGPGGESWRSRLVDMDCVHAAVRLPPKVSDRRGATALIMLREAKRATPSILMIDSQNIPSHGSLPTVGSQMLAIGSIVAMALDLRGGNIHGDGLQEEAELADNFLNREFSNGYSDVPGLCQVVSIELVKQKGFSFSPADYMSSVVEEKTFSRLRDEEVLALLKNVPGNKCIYIIGNNGEGKSFLLRSLVGELNLAKRTVIAMAFGSSDRFSFVSRRREDNAKYFYRGNRTGEKVAAGTQISSGLTADLLRISLDPLRLGTFTRLLEDAGFSPSVHLVRVATKRAWRDMSKVDSGVVDMASLEGATVAQREQYLRSVAAFRRAEWSDSIVPFTELSSGEQQILLMLVRIISLATEGAVALIDEPETSLHVRWQRILPSILREMSAEFSMSVVVATHSPLIVAGANAEGDYCFSAARGTLHGIPSKERRSVGKVLLDGFETYTPGNLDLYEECAAVVASVVQASSSDDDLLAASENAIQKLEAMLTLIDSAEGVVDANAMSRDRELIVRAEMAIGQVIHAK